MDALCTSVIYHTTFVQNHTASVVLLYTLGRVVLPNGTAHRPDGRLLLHNLPGRFAVREIKIIDVLAYLDDLAYLDFLDDLNGKNIKERSRGGARAKIRDGEAEKHGDSIYYGGVE